MLMFPTTCFLIRQVVSEREKYQQSASSDSAVSAVLKFHVNDKFVLSPTDANYLLSIEIQMPIENVLVQVGTDVLISGYFIARLVFFTQVHITFQRTSYQSHIYHVLAV